MEETVLFNIVLGELGSLLTLQEVCLAWGVKSDLEKLKNILSTIEDVLLVAEEQQANTHRLTDRLGKIKEALYDAEDVLNEYQYDALRSQVVNCGGIKRKSKDLPGSMANNKARDQNPNDGDRGVETLWEAFEEHGQQSDQQLTMLRELFVGMNLNVSNQ